MAKEYLFYWTVSLYVEVIADPDLIFNARLRMKSYSMKHLLSDII